MSELKVKGTIKQIGEIQKFDSGFYKAEFVLTTDEKYPQDIKFESVKENADNLIKYNKVGDVVDVWLNLRGNEYKDKYYVSLVAWKVMKSDGKAPEGLNDADESDDLPF